ncbi:MAG: hypothetical protein ACT4OK_09070 [Gemmobacter sp.]
MAGKADDKPIEVAIEEFKLNKPWDAKLAKGAPGALAALKKELPKGRVKVGDSKEGYKLIGTITGPNDDEGRKTLDAAMSFTVAAAGDTSLKATGSSNGKLPDVNPKKLEKEVEVLMQEIAKKMGPAAREVVEKLAAKG